jgi:hypothetical protein
MIRVKFIRQWEDMGRIFKRDAIIGIGKAAWLESEKDKSDFVRYGIYNVSKAYISPFASDVEMLKLEQKYNQRRL